MDAPIPSKHLQSLAFTIVFFEVENCFEFSLQEKTKKLNKTNTNRCFIIADNGKGLCEVRATATGSGEEKRTLAKTFFIF